jgi:hypothetical protein
VKVMKVVRAFVIGIVTLIALLTLAYSLGAPHVKI